MADRPIQPEADPQGELAAPVFVLPGMRLTKEQLAAAQRTRDYHVRKLLSLVARSERAGDTGTRGER